MKLLLIGLGNPGADYEKNRHNIGFLLLDAFVKASSSFFEKVHLGQMARVKWKGKEIICLKPDTYMNLSGKAVGYWLQKEKILVENSLVVTDDLALELASMRFKPQGSDGGHNGLKNIAEILEHQNYPRLRFGIDRKFGAGGQSDYVLGDFSKEEWEIIEKKIPVFIELIHTIVALGMTKAMNLMNAKIK